MEEIFISVHANLDPGTSAALVGLVQVICPYVSNYFLPCISWSFYVLWQSISFFSAIDRKQAIATLVSALTIENFGRRCLLIVSYLGVSISYLPLAFFFNIKENGIMCSYISTGEIEICWYISHYLPDQIGSRTGFFYRLCYIGRQSQVVAIGNIGFHHIVLLPGCWSLSLDYECRALSPRGVKDVRSGWRNLWSHDVCSHQVWTNVGGIIECLGSVPGVFSHQPDSNAFHPFGGARDQGPVIRGHEKILPQAGP